MKKLLLLFVFVVCANACVTRLLVPGTWKRCDVGHTLDVVLEPDGNTLSGAYTRPVLGKQEVFPVYGSLTCDFTFALAVSLQNSDAEGVRSEAWTFIIATTGKALVGSYAYTDFTTAVVRQGTGTGNWTREC